MESYCEQQLVVIGEYNMFYSQRCDGAFWVTAHGSFVVV